MTVFLILLGLVLLVAGAEALVRGAAGLALHLGWSRLVVGLTVVSFGTSAPELTVSLTSALEGQGAVAMGNVVGSNIFNVAAILGVSAVICPLAVHVQLLRWDVPVMLASGILFAALFLHGDGLDRIDGALLVLGAIGYTVWTVVLGKRDAAAVAEMAPPPPRAPARLAAQVGLVVAGLALLVMGGTLFVHHTVEVARRFGVDDAVVGLTIIAAGTSLPELATSVMAAIHRQTDVAIGNVIGSNTLNVLGIAGGTGLVRPVEASGIDGGDLMWMLGLSLVLIPMMFSRFTLSRWEGGVLVAGYAGYLWWMWPA